VLWPDLEPLATGLLYGVAVLTVTSGLDYTYRTLRMASTLKGEHEEG
jgi:hypothetical protein